MPNSTPILRGPSRVPAFHFPRVAKLAAALLLTGLSAGGLAGAAAVPPPEKLLPDDTLFLVTAPDFTRLTQVCTNSPYLRLWNDPAMKNFRAKFATNWQENFVQPLERELKIKLDDYAGLLQGQVTLAIIRDGWQGEGDIPPAVLLLIDAQGKAAALRKHLAGFRQQWTAAGKPLRTERIRDVEFIAITPSSNDVPATVRKLLPAKSSPVEEVGQESAPVKTSPKTEWFIGQVDSMMVFGSSPKAVEKVVVHATGGNAPALADLAVYQSNHQALFRNSPLYAWVNVKAFVDLVLRKAAEAKDNPDAPNPFDIKPDKVINVLGLGGLKSAAFSFHPSQEGSLFEAFLGVPENSRQGLVKILAGEPKPFQPPACVPAEALKFQRWRIDGRKAWATLEQMLKDISPQALNTLNFLLDTANTAARDSDPGFDIRKNLIGNLGDDLVSYTRAPAAKDGGSSSSLYLLGSPNPEQLAGALKGVLVYLGQQVGVAPKEREFLGRKIYSVQLNLPFLAGAGSGGTPPTLHYCAASSYLALSTDASMVEAYLRTTDTPCKPLSETAGLAQAIAKVAGPNTSLFGYENQLESMRLFFDTLSKAKDSNGGRSNGQVTLTVGLPLSASLAPALDGLKEWLDCSLLPPFEKLSKYFSFSVYAGSATVAGLDFKVFTPVPPTGKP